MGLEKTILYFRASAFVPDISVKLAFLLLKSSNRKTAFTDIFSTQYVLYNAFLKLTILVECNCLRELTNFLKHTLIVLSCEVLINEYILIQRELTKLLWLKFL